MKIQAALDFNSSRMPGGADAPVALDMVLVGFSRMDPVTGVWMKVNR